MFNVQILTFCVSDGMHELVLLRRASALWVRPPTTAINVLKFWSWRRRFDEKTLGLWKDSSMNCTSICWSQSFSSNLRNFKIFVSIWVKFNWENAEYIPAKFAIFTLATLMNLTIISARCCGVVLLSTMHWTHCESPLKRAIDRSNLGLSFRDAWTA